MGILRSLVGVVRRRFDDTEAWLSTPVGCCECGTGGPYYEGDKPQVTHYVYVGATAKGDGTVDWTSCSDHPRSRGWSRFSTTARTSW